MQTGDTGDEERGSRATRVVNGSLILTRKARHVETNFLFSFFRIPRIPCLHPPIPSPFVSTTKQDAELNDGRILATQPVPVPLRRAVPASRSALVGCNRRTARGISPAGARRAGGPQDVCRRPGRLEPGRPGLRGAHRRQDPAGLVPRQSAGGQRRPAAVDRHPRHAQYPPRQPLLPSLCLSAGRGWAAICRAGGRPADYRAGPGECPADPARPIADSRRPQARRLSPGGPVAGRRVDRLPARRPFAAGLHLLAVRSGVRRPVAGQLERISLCRGSQLVGHARAGARDAAELAHKCEGRARAGAGFSRSRRG